MRRVFALLTAAVVGSSGCGRPDPDGQLVQEARRYAYVHECGPLIAASVVASFAPLGPTSVLNGFSADQGWQAFWRPPDAEVKLNHVPSIFELPDPGRPVRFGYDSPAQASKPVL